MTIWKRILKFSSYLTLYIFLTAFFIYLRFPYNKIQPHLFSLIESSVPIKISAAELKPNFINGISLKDIRVKERGNIGGEELIKIDELTIKLSLFSILKASLAVTLEAQTLGGAVNGKLRQIGDQYGVTLSIKNLDLGKLRVVGKEYGINIFGKVTGDTDLILNFNNLPQSSGDIKFLFSDVALESDLYIKTFLPDKEKLFLGNTTGNFKIDSQNLKIEEFKIQNGDIMGDVTGMINLKKPLVQSRLNCEARLKLADDIASKVNTFISGFSGKKQDSEGYFKFKIRGTIERPSTL